MSVSYDVITDAFLNKITEFDFPIGLSNRDAVVDGYMKRTVYQFDRVLKTKFAESADDSAREYTVNTDGMDIDEVADIISEGMVVQWLKPYVYQSENMVTALNTRDYSSYSPAELLFRIKGTHDDAQKRFTNMVRHYSYSHGSLKDLWL